MKIRSFVSRGWLLALVAGSALGAPAPRADESAPAGGVAAEAAFLVAQPRAEFIRSEGRITTVYGPAFQHGADAVATAEAFLRQNAPMFGVAFTDLQPGTLATDGASTHQLMLDRERGGYKFTLVSYLQTVAGVPVFQSDVRLLVRNETDHPLVLVRSALRPVGDFQVDEIVAAAPNVVDAFTSAKQRFPGIGDFTPPRLVVFAGTADNAAPAQLALEFEGTVGFIGGDTYEKWHVVTDAATGAVIWSDSLIEHTNVTGSVKAMATPGYKADICATEVVTALPYARVFVGATPTDADANGNFTITNGGTSQITVASGIRGKYFRVWDSANAGADPDAMTMNVTPPGPANFVHNPSNNNATKLSGANAYISANKVRDYALTYAPNFPTISTQPEFRVNVNVSGTCNAFYDGSSINFYAAGGGCPSTAFGDVVYHEYGHHMVQSAGSGQGQYGEGYGDLNGVMIDDDPGIGYGFQGNCNSPLRTAANNMTYPCSGEVHACAPLLTACFWSTRILMVQSNPSDYRTFLKDWAVNSVLMHTGDQITPSITVDVLTLDDDDSDITNGTPHYTQINGGFGAHNMPGPKVDALKFTYPGGRPAVLDPDGGDSFQVVVTPNLSNTLDTTSGKFYVDPEADGTYVSYPMTYLGNNTFKATFPAIACGSAVRYYVEAKTGSGAALQSPTGAPTSFFGATSARGFNVAWPASGSPDNCETNTGWVASRIGANPPYSVGDWSRGVPVSSPGAPPSDYDASGKCWLTGNYTGGVDDPDPSTAVKLTSPTMDATVGDVEFNYARWFSTTDPGNDKLVVELSNNNGASWTTIETLTTSTSGWEVKSHHLSDFLPRTNQMKIAFTVYDVGSDSVVEAGLDALSLATVSCFCPADFNHDGFVNGDDFDGFTAAFDLGDPAADFNHDGFVTGDDFDGFSVAFDSGC